MYTNQEARATATLAAAELAQGDVLKFADLLEQITDYVINGTWTGPVRQKL